MSESERNIVELLAQAGRKGDKSAMQALIVAMSEEAAASGADDKAVQASISVQLEDAARLMGDTSAMKPANSTTAPRHSAK